MAKKGWNNGQWPVERLRARLADRLARRSEITEAGCVEWTGAKDRQGYGFTSFGTYKKTTRTHRAAYALKHDLPVDFSEGVVCHRCDNPSCINPDHLFLGTPLDNMRDKVAKGRQTKGESHGTGKKLTEGAVRLIREDQRSQSAIARDYGVCQHTISAIKRRKIWKHVS